MDVAATQYLLGVRPTKKGLVIDPTIPAGWKSFSVSRIYRGCVLEVSVNNPDSIQHGVKSVSLDGVPVSGGCITPELLAGKQRANMAVIMG